MTDNLEVRAVDQIRFRGGCVAQTCGLKTPRRTQHASQRRWLEVPVSPSLVPGVHRHSWGEAQLVRMSLKGKGGAAYGANSQHGGVCTTEVIDSGGWSAGPGRSEYRTSRVDCSARYKCYHCSH